MEGRRLAPALRERVSRAVAQQGLRRFQSQIVDWLLAQMNRDHLRKRVEEMQRPPARRRGMESALDSAELLAEAGCAAAKANRRQNLTLEDVRQAAASQSGLYWPFA
jgi:hypothetical protein